MRLNSETPARRALNEFLRPVKRPRGRPTKTWFECIKKDLKDMNIELNPKKLEEVIKILNHIIKYMFGERIFFYLFNLTQRDMTRQSLF